MAVKAGTFMILRTFLATLVALSTQQVESSNNATSLQQSQPTLCSNRCVFFGTADRKGLCSKCFNDLITKNMQAVRGNVDVAMPPITLRPLNIKRKTYKDALKLAGDDQSSPEAEERKMVKKNKIRCGKCNKKVGLIGVECRCGITFCGTHRYVEVHECGFDYKEKGKNEIACHIRRG